jgi:hypothetical protein
MRPPSYRVQGCNRLRRTPPCPRRHRRQLGQRLPQKVTRFGQRPTCPSGRASPAGGQADHGPGTAGPTGPGDDAMPGKSTPGKSWSVRRHRAQLRIAGCRDGYAGIGDRPRDRSPATARRLHGTACRGTGDSRSARRPAQRGALESVDQGRFTACCSLAAACARSAIGRPSLVRSVD